MAYFGENTVHAWANINCVNGQDTIRDSYNISSITDFATGRQIFNFSTNAANNDYAVAACSGNATSTTTAARARNPDNEFTTGGFRIRNMNVDGNSTGTAVNDSFISIVCCSHT